MDCPHCGKPLVEMHLLTDQPESYRDFSNAKLIGFTDPNGFRCENSRFLHAIYATDAEDNLRRVVYRDREWAKRRQEEQVSTWTMRPIGDILHITLLTKEERVAWDAHRLANKEWRQRMISGMATVGDVEAEVSPADIIT
jgi:hypothetical protein